MAIRKNQIVYPVSARIIKTTRQGTEKILIAVRKLREYLEKGIQPDLLTVNECCYFSANGTIAHPTHRIQTSKKFFDMFRPLGGKKERRMLGRDSVVMRKEFDAQLEALILSKSFSREIKGFRQFLQTHENRKFRAEPMTAPRPNGVSHSPIGGGKPRSGCESRAAHMQKVFTEFLDR